MRLILVGCEYAGKTTLANEIVGWIGRTMGSSRTFHDHFSIPNAELPEEDKEPFAALSPYLRQLFQLYMLNHHFHDTFYSKPDHNLVGFRIEEAIYGPLYYGYAADGDIGSPLARRLEEEIMQKAPDTVLILLRAQPKVIVRRIAEARHEWKSARGRTGTRCASTSLSKMLMVWIRCANYGGQRSEDGPGVSQAPEPLCASDGLRNR